MRNGRNIILGSIPALDGCWGRAEDGHLRRWPVVLEWKGMIWSRVLVLEAQELNVSLIKNISDENKGRRRIIQLTRGEG